MTGAGTGPDGARPDAPGPAHGRGGRVRKQPLHLGAEAWHEARLLFENDGVDARELAERFGVTRPTIERRIRQDGWVRQGELRDLMASGDTRGLSRMVARLIAAFDAQIRAVEAQFLDASEARALGDPASVERNARTLGSLAKTLDILIALRGGLTGQDNQAERDADGLRRELERRLERLCRQGPAATVPGGARPGGA